MATRFTYNSKPMIRHRRSQFDLSRRHLTTINMGQLVPIFWEEVLPGDTMKGHMKEVIRTTTPFIKPIMDNLFVDTYFFFVPNRLVMKDWAKVIGDDTGSSSWSAPDLKTVPSVSFLTGSIASAVTPQSLADYFGIPTGVSNSSLALVGDISSLLFRAYALIYNEWFRDENNEDPVMIQLGDSDSTPVNSEQINGNPFSSSNYTGMPAFVNKVHDRFTSALPSPQKGDPISIALISNASVLPVKTTEYGYAGFNELPTNIYPLQFYVGSSKQSDDDGFVGYKSFNPSMLQNDLTLSKYTALRVNTSYAGNTAEPMDKSVADLYGFSNNVSGQGSYIPVSPANLAVDLSEAQANPLTINDLRLAFQMQKYLEKDARGGSRYIEFLREHFGVIAGDARLQRPEYLGGKRTPISIYQENQTSASTTNSPLGQVAGWSLTQSDSGFTKGFVEHGFIIGLACVRQFHTYQQGIHPAFFRHTRYDYYDPVFSNIGEQPVYTREIYADGGVNANTVFGYQEAWSEYRQSTNRVSGYMRSSAPETLDIWHLADKYDSQPVLGQQFLQESSANVDRVLSVDSSETPNFLFDTYIDLKAVRVMPTYSTPGLIDHH